MSKSFWWSDFATIIGPGFAKLRAAQLHRAGLRKDAWEGDGFISAESARGKFGLKKTEYNSRKFALRTLTRAWAGLLTGIISRADPQEWIGVFEDNPSSLPSVVFTTGSIPNLIIGALAQECLLPPLIDPFEVLPTARCLVKLHPGGWQRGSP
jgi:hypothetical protein